MYIVIIIFFLPSLKITVVLVLVGVSPGGGGGCCSTFFFIARPFRDILAPIPSVSPLVLEEYSRELAEFPSHKRRYVLNGIQFGFRVGWEPQRVSLRSRASNMRSATAHPDVVDEYLRTDLGVWRAPFHRPSITIASC